MFRRCRREYFLHYHAAAGGFRSDAPPETRLIYQQKQLSGLRLWLTQLLRQAVYRTLYRYPDDRPEPAGRLTAELWRLYHRDRRALLLENWRDDPAGSPNLPEFYYDCQSPEQLFQEAQALLETGLAAFQACARFHRLWDLTLFHLMPLEQWQRFYLGAVELYLTAAFAYQRHGQLYFWEIQLPGAAEIQRRDLAALHKFYAFGRRHLSPDKVTTFFYQPGASRAEVLPDADLNCSELRLLIDAEAAQFLSAFRSIRSPEELPETPEHCPGCRFRGYCRQTPHG